MVSPLFFHYCLPMNAKFRYYKAWSMGSGPCHLCNECDPRNPCKHGLQARPSMEACGIDVFATARAHGFPIEVVRNYGGNRNHYGVILLE